MIAALTALGLLVGVMATVVMDMASNAGRALGLVGGVDPRLIGRWMGNIPRGKLIHRDIRQVPPLAREMSIAMAAHYSIGAALGLLFVLLASALHVPLTSFAAAIGFGAATNLLPWLIMFPAFGFGPFGTRGPKDARLLWSSCWNHLAFGLGLALWLQVLARL